MRRLKWSSVEVSALMYFVFLLYFLLASLWDNSEPANREPEVFDVRDDVNFLLWTRENPKLYDILQVDNATGLKMSHFNKDLPTKMLIHGFQDTGTTGWIINVKDKYLQSEPCNVISVDWRKLANTYPFYNVAASNTKPVGFLAADLISFLVEKGGTTLSDIHPVGFSLGAQVAGHLGYKLQGTLSRITGLDPAGLLFHYVPPSERLDPSDADFVDVVHTTGLWIGMGDPVGHVDFYPNNGHNPQPGCDGEGFGLECSHQRANQLWAESIYSKTGFQSFKCESWAAFSTGQCDLKSVEQNFMGEPASKKNPGIYYLRTYSKPPFAIPPQFVLF